MQFVHVASVVSPPLLFFFFRSAGKKSAIVGAEMEIFTSDRARSRGFIRGRGGGREGGAGILMTDSFDPIWRSR